MPSMILRGPKNQVNYGLHFQFPDIHYKWYLAIEHNQNYNHKINSMYKKFHRKYTYKELSGVRWGIPSKKKTQLEIPFHLNCLLLPKDNSQDTNPHKHLPPGSLPKTASPHPPFCSS